MSVNDNSVLIMDIGGTNVRAALSNPDGFEQVRTYKRSTMNTTESLSGAHRVILDYCAAEGITVPKKTVAAVAGPTDDTASFTLTNDQGHWGEINFDALGDELGTEFHLINDFAAQAFAPLLLDPEKEYHHLIQTDNPGFFPNKIVGHVSDAEVLSDITSLINAPHKKAYQASDSILILGPGTGLGTASAFVVDNKYVVLDGEAAHGTFPVKTQREFDVRQKLAAAFGDVSFETVCSGPGLKRVYDALREIDPNYANADDIPSEQITKRAIADECDVCVETVEFFTRALGRAAGNMALSSNTTNVIISGGGIVEALGRHFDAAIFKEEFVSNTLGKNNYLRDVPVNVAMHEQPGLLGAHAYARLAL